MAPPTSPETPPPPLSGPAEESECEVGVLSAAGDAIDFGLRGGLYFSFSFKVYGVIGGTLDLDIASFHPQVIHPGNDRFTSGAELSADLFGFPFGYELFKREINISEVASPLRDLFSQPPRSGWILPTQVGSGAQIGRIGGSIGLLGGIEGSFDLRDFFLDVKSQCP